jgi:hypothetical protein
MELKFELRKGHVVLMLAVAMLVFGGVSVLADLDDPAPEPGHHSTQIDGIPICSFGEYITHNNGVWGCIQGAEPQEMKPINCFASSAPGNPNAFQGSKWISDVSSYPASQNCNIHGASFTLVGHSEFYSFGGMTDWNNVQNKEWYVAGDYVNNQINCFASGPSTPGAVAGVGLCLGPLTDSGDPINPVPPGNFDSACDWEGTRCNCNYAVSGNVEGGDPDEGYLYGTLIVGTDCSGGKVLGTKIVDYKIQFDLGWGQDTEDELCPPPPYGPDIPAECDFYDGV